MTIKYFQIRTKALGPDAIAIIELREERGGHIAALEYYVAEIGSQSMIAGGKVRLHIHAFKEEDPNWGEPTLWALASEKAAEDFINQVRNEVASSSSPIPVIQPEISTLTRERVLMLASQRKMEWIDQCKKHATSDALLNELFELAHFPKVDWNPITLDSQG